MDPGKRLRLGQEIIRNNKRIEDCMKEAEILEARNYDIQEELDA